MEYRAQYISRLPAHVQPRVHAVVSAACVRISEIPLRYDEISTKLPEAQVDRGESWMR